MKQQKIWQGFSNKRRNSAFFLVAFLGTLTAFAPFVTDMYLPSLPAMTVYFNASVSAVQMGLMFSILGLAVGQIIFGPLSDKYGRRAPLLVSMMMFLLATAGCVFAPDIQTFVALRLLQGIASAGGIVIARSVAADKFKGRRLAVALAVVGAINGVAPVAAPVIGGGLLQITTWRGVFAVLFVLGLLTLAACIHFKESLSKKRRAQEKISQTLRLFKPLFSNRQYMCYTLQTAFAQALLFAYIAASPFIIQRHYGFSPFAFSLFFAVNAFALTTGAGVAVKFKRMETAARVSGVGMLAGALAVWAALAADASVWTFEACVVFMLTSLGVLFTSATALAMDAARERAGTASALFGALCFFFGALATPVVGLGNMLVSAGVTLAVCAFVSLAFNGLVRVRRFTE